MEIVDFAKNLKGYNVYVLLPTLVAIFLVVARINAIFFKLSRKTFKLKLYLMYAILLIIGFILGRAG